ncbi:FAD-binding oxidoreductase [Sphingomonas baiyangensis]|uniref:FAD-binding oxidoreductase n=2 Tax=Sphingomonas baiyangensis TaxID=2572576 RepID=A0A4U1KZU3_9SPHN|nr:FAD-binding oxidoreductase [Sphingomonas baiyangensis]
MTPAQSTLIATIAEQLGPRAVVTDADDIAPWLVDWRGRYHGAAPAILSPATTHEAARIVMLAREHGVPLVPQGGNTSMVGGATPPADGSALIVSMRRMRTIRRIDAAAGLAIADAGVILAELHEAADTAGMRFPLTLGARGSATIGGLVSTNAGGTQVLRHGTMRRLVAGVEAVLPDGSVHDGLAALKKDTRGYDLDQLLIGAEGTLGLVTGAALRLAPRIAVRAVGWAGLASPDAALDLLRRFEAASDMVESFELIPGDTLARAVAHLPDARAPLAGTHRWHVLVEAASGDATADPAALIERVLATAIEAGLVEDAVLAASEAQAEAFWRLRDSLSAAERAAGPAMQHDISVPVPAMPRFLTEAAAAVEARFPGTHAGGFGHLGDGNVHFHVRAPKGIADAEAWYAGDGAAASRFVHDLVIAAGGSIAAEHGIGQMKRAELLRTAPPARIAALRAIKAAFDPAGLFNPGKLVSLAPEGDAT